MDQSTYSSGALSDGNTFPDGSIFDDFGAEEEEIVVSDDLVHLCNEQAKLQKRRKDLREELKEVENAIEAGQPRIKAVMEARGVQSIKIEGVGTVYLQANPYPKVLQRESFVEWLDSQGEGAIAVRTVNPQTLRSWTKDRMAAGHDLPPDDVLSVFVDKEVRIRAK